MGGFSNLALYPTFACAFCAGLSKASGETRTRWNRRNAITLRPCLQHTREFATDRRPRSGWTTTRSVPRAEHSSVCEGSGHLAHDRLSKHGASELNGREMTYPEE